MAPVLETPRLTLHRLTPDDLDFMAALLGDPAVMGFWPEPFTREDAAAWIATAEGDYARHGVGYWLARLRATGEPIGQAGVLMRKVFETLEPSVGYIFAKRAWGQGLASEAATACFRYGLDVLGAPRVLCMIRPENVPSLRVAARLRLMPVAHTVYADLAHLVFICDRTTPGFEQATSAAKA
ncbi:MAG: GNAT family N-acetyltransferase [Phycisphaerales bacterium]|nr:GNAT family N-acetyltransferase [Phycisphaerales bacterium]